MKPGRPIRSALIFGGCLLIALALVLGGFYYRSRQARIDAEESRRADQSLCVIQNENRAATRVNSAALFASLSARIRYSPPKDAHTRRIFRRQAALLEAQLEALQPIDCTKYVRPVFIPPQGGVPLP